MIPVQLIRPIIGVVINTVIAVERTFNPEADGEKKKKAIKDAGVAVYEMVESMLGGLPDDIDQWAENLIDKAIEASVEFYNTRYKSNFTEYQKANAEEYALAKLTEAGVIQVEAQTISREVISSDDVGEVSEVLTQEAEA